MLRVHRVGDRNSAGGRITKGDNSMIVDGRPVAPIGSPVSPHKPCPKKKKHCNAKTAQGSSSFYVGGKKVTVETNKDTCGHTRVAGSPNFFVNKG
jgi:uncharacterized Zn-binding protein involved in type VI secretion